jgi:hypothetical protein
MGFRHTLPHPVWAVMLYGIGWNLFGGTFNRRFDPRRFGRV